MEAYEKPEITDLGSLETLTLGEADGDQLDADFPAGTSKSDLTFS